MISAENGGSEPSFEDAVPATSGINAQGAELAKLQTMVALPDAPGSRAHLGRGNLTLRLGWQNKSVRGAENALPLGGLGRRRFTVGSALT